MSRAGCHRLAPIRSMMGPMRRFILEIAAAAALTVGAILASAGGVLASDIVVRDAFARASPTPAAQAGVVYFSLYNTGAAVDRLIDISTPAARAASLHRTVTDGDMMRMEPAGAAEIAPGATLVMAPGGLHVMLMGLKAPLQRGDAIDVILTLEKAGTVRLQVPVASVSAAAPD